MILYFIFDYKMMDVTVVVVMTMMKMMTTMVVMIMMMIVSGLYLLQYQRSK